MKIHHTALAFLLTFQCSAIFAAGTLEVRAPDYGWANAEYTTSHVFIDEVAGTTAAIDIRFTPGYSNITDVEVYSNLNRRHLARADKDGDNVPDGIDPVNGSLTTDSAADTDPVSGHYYIPHNMPHTGGGIYELTINAAQTGAYRIGARFKVSDAISENGFNPNNWIWYGLRDHAVVVSPVDARNIRLYEINVFNIDASGDLESQRSTLEDLHDAPGAQHTAANRWNLDYLANLGCNWLWFQPIHPIGIDGREPEGGFGSGTPIYQPGSPYAVKNFFEVNPRMTVNYNPGLTTYNSQPIDPKAHPTNRAAAMTAFQNFASAADTQDISLMLDAAFNHTGFDVELGPVGVSLLEPDGQTWSELDEIRNRDARFFSQNNSYGDRAFNSGSIAAAPDRNDFGKWNDVKDVFFGRYDALVENSGGDNNTHVNEGDWYDTGDSDWTSSDFIQGGIGRNITQRAWDYFADYAVYWLEKTRPAGENRNSSTEAGLSLEQRYEWDARGIDGLRCDFGQGLPPRCWEYIINVARNSKWNFVMMSESLDGGAVTYRSNRHFDILNENIVFGLKSASNYSDYRNLYEGRRTAYGQGLVLSNTSSHDEENYGNAWDAVVRFSVGSTMDGASMIFPGQELGIGTTWGYDHYEWNLGKQIPHFKRWNSMMPAWNDTDYGNDQLYHVYAGMNRARAGSPALRSSNRWFLTGDGFNSQVFGVAKYEEPNASPAQKDVVLAFSNLSRASDQSDNFKINSTLANLIGIKSDRTYNVKNRAAYTGLDGGRDDVFLWGGGLTGSQLVSSGFSVFLKKVPSSAGDWASVPFEAHYLKLHDVTPPPPPTKPENDDQANGEPKSYVIGNSITFNWQESPSNTIDDNIASYDIVIKDAGGATLFSDSVAATSYTYNGAAGQEVYAIVTAVSVAGISGTPGDASDSIRILAAGSDDDNDGQSNEAEDAAQTDPLDENSYMHVHKIANNSGNITVYWNSALNVSYAVLSNDSLIDPVSAWALRATGITGTGSEMSWTDPVPVTPPSSTYYTIGVESP